MYNIYGKMKVSICAIICLVIQNMVFVQTQESIFAPNNDDKESVVNVYCRNDGPSRTSDEPESRRIEQGKPGKRGMAGPVGITGPKGLKGDKGTPGNDAQFSSSDVRKEIINMIVTSCDDAKLRGITETGPYFRLAPDFQLEYIFCIFDTSFSTCHQIRNRLGYNTTGTYYIIKTQSQPFYKLQCNFTTENAITEVWHDEMDEVELSPKCEAEGCYSWIPKYSLANGEISNIIANSRECRQFVKLRCKGVRLFRDGFGHWISSDNQKMNYWGGATSRRAGYCACGETDSCHDNTYNCNCDNNNDLITSDEGYFTDKNKLPMKELKIGDNGDSSERAWRTIGKLECMG